MMMLMVMLMMILMMMLMTFQCFGHIAPEEDEEELDEDFELSP
jgi:hypothetical protein